MITPERMALLDQGSEPKTAEEREHRNWMMRRFPPIHMPPRGADTFQECDWTNHPMQRQD